MIRFLILLIALLTPGIALAQPVRIERNVARSKATLAAAKAESGWKDGELVTTQGFAAAGDSGGIEAIYRASGWSALSTVKQNGPFYINTSGDAYLEVRNKRLITAPQAGLFAADSGADLVSGINAVFDAIEAEGGGSFELAPRTTYDLENAQITIENGVYFDGKGSILQNCLLAVGAEGDSFTIRNVHFQKTNNDTITGLNYHGLNIRGTDIVCDNLKFTTTASDRIESAFRCVNIRNAKLTNFYFGDNAGAGGVFMSGINVVLDNWVSFRSQNDDFIALKGSSSFSGTGCRNWTITNLDVTGSAAAVSIGSQADPDVPMENISVSNVVARDCAKLAYIKAGYGSTSSSLVGQVFRGISINNWTYITDDPERIHDTTQIIELTARGAGGIDGLEIGNGTAICRQNTKGGETTSSVVVFRSAFEGGDTCSYKNINIHDITVSDSISTIGTQITPDNATNSFTVADTYVSTLTGTVDSGADTYVVSGEFAEDTPMTLGFASGIGNALPSPLSTSTRYYMVSVSYDGMADQTTFSVAATAGGAAINLTTAGTGTQYVYTVDNILLKLRATASGALPTGLSAGTQYYAINGAFDPDTDLTDFQVAASEDGAAVSFSDDGTGNIFAIWDGRPIDQFIYYSSSDVGGGGDDFGENIRIHDIHIEQTEKTLFGTLPSDWDITYDRVSVSNLPSNPETTDSRPIVLIGPNTDPLTNFRVLATTALANIKSDPVTYASTGNLLPNPLVAQWAYIYGNSSAAIALPDWIKRKEVQITGTGKTPINNSFTVHIPPFARCYIPKIELTVDTDVAVDASSYGQFTVAKGAPPYSSTRTIVSRWTEDTASILDGLALTANTPEPMMRGLHNSHYVQFHGSKGTESWIDYDEGLVFTYTPTNNGIVLDNLRATIYYFEF